MIGLLLGLKLRLLARAFARGRGWAGALALGGLALAFSPFWAGLTLAAYRAGRAFGAPAAALVMVLCHFGWLGTSLLLGSFAEGFDLRALLRFPIAPRAAFLVNVLVAPVDFAALFVMVPLAAVVLAVGRDRPLAGAALALAAVLVVFTTAATAQALLAVLGRYLRREWTRALFGLLVGVAAMVPTFLLRQEAARSLPGVSALVAHAAGALLGPGVELARWFPLTAFPARAALAAGAGQGAGAALWLLGGVGLLFVLVELGGRLCLREALERQAPLAGAGGSDDAGAERRWARLLPADLAVLVGREVRTFRRTPQILLGLLMAPLLLVIFGQRHVLGSQSWPFIMALVSLVSALNLSANQFGLDQAGVRLLFLLPVAPRRLIVAKNLACVVVVAGTAAGCVVVGLLRGPRLDVVGALTGLAVLAAALPVVLTVGNHLSIAHPWRMTFRLGGAPPGAMASAFAQMAALAAVALLLVPPLVLLPVFFGEGLAVRLGSLAIIGAAAALLWLFWAARLAAAARALERNREKIVDRLARAEETG